MVGNCSSLWGICFIRYFVLLKKCFVIPLVFIPVLVASFLCVYEVRDSRVESEFVEIV